MSACTPFLFDDPSGSERPRVLHFVTGGFSGATQVALDLVDSALKSGRVQPLLVLRRKPQTPPQRIEALEQAGIPVQVVPGWSHAATVWSLLKICRSFRPDVLVAHGFSEHLWGRYAGLLAKVPVLVHVEHNSRERYTRWRLAQARWLARRTARIVGCSEGVRLKLLELGFPSERTVAISNGVRLQRFAQAASYPFEARQPGLVMSARFGRQKDHGTLLKALALLREKDLRPPVLLAGSGKSSNRRVAESLAAELGLAGQVSFLGHCDDVPGLLMTHQICVLSTHYEGMPLSLVEGMAAGCAVVGSAVPGVRELIKDGHNGCLVPPSDPAALAEVLEKLLRSPALGARLGAAARATALEHHGLELMATRYETLFLSLTREARVEQA